MTTFRTAVEEDLPELIAMAMDLWPDGGEPEMEAMFTEILTSSKFNVAVAAAEPGLIAFIYLGIRTDYVEGADYTPTGFVEGLYVKPAFRKTGIARELLNKGEAWTRQAGCRQMGSDISISNQVSYDFHIRAGFREAGRLIAFIKELQITPR